MTLHHDVIEWKHFSCYWPFVRRIHRTAVDSPHKGQSRGALRFSLTCAWTNGWANNRDADDLRRHRAHYDVTVMENYTACCHELYWRQLYIQYVPHKFYQILRGRGTWLMPFRSIPRFRFKQSRAGDIFVIKIDTSKTNFRFHMKTETKPVCDTVFGHKGTLIVD